jgi:hypothetical protein
MRMVNGTAAGRPDNAVVVVTGSGIQGLLAGPCGQMGNALVALQWRQIV